MHGRQVPPAEPAGMSHPTVWPASALHPLAVSSESIGRHCHQGRRSFAKVVRRHDEMQSQEGQQSDSIEVESILSGVIC